jgi:hypothetical protein
VVNIERVGWATEGVDLDGRWLDREPGVSNAGYCSVLVRASLRWIMKYHSLKTGGIVVT